MTLARVQAVVEKFTTVVAADAPLELASLDLVELVAALEDAFGFRVRGTEVVPDNFSTLARIAAFIERKSRE